MHGCVHRLVLRPPLTCLRPAWFSSPPASCGWESSGFSLCPPFSYSLPAPGQPQGLVSQHQHRLAWSEIERALVGTQGSLVVPGLFSQEWNQLLTWGLTCFSLERRCLARRMPQYSLGDGIRQEVVGVLSLSTPSLTSSPPLHPSGRKRLELFLDTALSTHHLLGPSIGHREWQGLTSRLPPPGLLAGSLEAACAGAGRGGLRVGAGSPGPWLREAASPAPLSFYELQREAKFPQPPNETESKSELIGNRRGGRGLAREKLGPALGWELCV